MLMTVRVDGKVANSGVVADSELIRSGQDGDAGKHTIRVVELTKKLHSQIQSYVETW